MNKSSFSWLWPVAGGGVLFLCLVVLVGTYTFLPVLVGSSFGKSMKSEMSLQKTPEVSVKSEPPPAMLAGTFAQGQVALEATEFGGVRPREVMIDLDPFDLNVLKSMRSGRFVSEEPLSGELRIEVSEQEVTRIAGSVAEGISVEGVELEKDQVTVESGTRILGVEVPVVVRGGMEIRDQQLVFEPRRVSAFGVRLPDRLSEELLSEANFSYSLRDLPYDADISSIEVRKNYVILSGRLEDIPLDAEGG